MQLLCCFVLIGIANIANAQTIISFDASPDNAMVMKIQDPSVSGKTDKLIFIFDSTMLTCEFSDGDIIAFHATSHKSDSGEITSSYTYSFSDKSVKADEMINFPNDPEKEEPLSLEDWMMCPGEWNANRRL